MEGRWSLSLLAAPLPGCLGHQNEKSEEARNAGFESWLLVNREDLGAQRDCPECTCDLRKCGYSPILQLDMLRLEDWEVTHSEPYSWVPMEKLHPSTEDGCSALQTGTRRTLFRSLSPEPRPVECLPACSLSGGDPSRSDCAGPHCSWHRGGGLVQEQDPLGLAMGEGIRTPEETHRAVSCFHSSVCMHVPWPRPPAFPGQRQACGPAPPPLEPSQRPPCLQCGVEKSHPSP